MPYQCYQFGFRQAHSRIMTGQHIQQGKDLTPSPNIERKKMETENYNDEINLLDFVKIILKNKNLICWVVGISVVVTIIISLIMTPIFEAKAVIMPVKTPDSQSGFGMIAARFGRPDLSHTSEIMGLLQSNVLKERVIRKHQLLPILFKASDLEGKTDDEKIWSALHFLDSALKVTSKQKDGGIEISMQFKDKKVAADIVNYMLTALAEYMSGEAKRVAEINKKQLRAIIDQKSDPLLRANVYNLIAKQIETAAMAEATENFAFKVIDPPKVPDVRIKPRRARMVMISFFVALFLGVFIAFGREYAVTHRGELSELSGLSKVTKIVRK